MFIREVKDKVKEIFGIVEAKERKKERKNKKQGGMVSECAG